MYVYVCDSTIYMSRGECSFSPRGGGAAYKYLCWCVHSVVWGEDDSYT